MGAAAVLAFLTSPAGVATATFLLSEVRSGVSYLMALRNGEVTVDDAMAAFARGSAVFNEGDAAVDAAEKIADGKA